MLRWIMVLGILLVSFVLTRLIPFSSYFRNMNTMIHELGHAIAALLTSGEVYQIVMNADHSGVTYAAVTSEWSAFVVGIAGYPVGSLLAVALFYMYYRTWQKRGLLYLSLFAMIMLVFFVHGGFGIGWLTGFILLNLFMLLLGRTVRGIYFLLLAFLTLEESVWGTVNLLLLAWLEPTTAGDAANLAALTGVPAVVWAFGFLIFSLWCAQRAIVYFFRALGERLERMERARHVTSNEYYESNP